MPSDDDDHPDTNRLLKLLESIGFPDRYYGYCGAHATSGPDIPLVTQQAALAATGRTFRSGWDVARTRDEVLAQYRRVADFYRTAAASGQGVLVYVP